MSRPILPDALRARFDDREPTALLDVRSPRAYAEGHVRECTPLPREELEFRISELVPDRKTTVVLVDDEGERAPHDAEWLEALGYESVYWLEGGTAGAGEEFEIVSAVDGVYSTAFNYDSKLFGEQVEANEELPKLDPAELDEKTEEEDPLIVDVRTPAEHTEMTIPGSINVEGVDLGLYVDELRDADQPVVVHCAGRTRSIIGTATLRRLGYENVYELENGTMGWELEGYDLESGSDRRIADLDVDSPRYTELRERVEKLIEDRGIETVDPSALTEPPENAPFRYLIDVRTEAEYEEGTIPGARWVPGGQLIQTTDQQIAVREAEIVLVSDTHVRSGITAHWLDEMGLPNVTVVRGGIDAWVDIGDVAVPEPSRPVGESLLDGVETYSPTALEESLEEVVVLDVRSAGDFEADHLPGAKWVPRVKLEEVIESDAVGPDRPIVVYCRDGSVSAYGAAETNYVLDSAELAVLEGGFDAWLEAGLPTTSGTDGMLDEEDVDVEKVYEQGPEAMETYLRWEANLIEE